MNVNMCLNIRKHECKHLCKHECEHLGKHECKQGVKMIIDMCTTKSTNISVNICKD